MAPHVGPQYDVAALASTVSFEIFAVPMFTDVQELTSAQRASLARVRAFAVPSLVDVEVTAAGDTALSAALARELRARIPGVPWKVGDDVLWGIRKHLMCLTAVAAPVDDTTGAAMALQLYGPVIAIDGTTPDSMREQMWQRLTDGYPPRPIDQRFTVRIEVATYANIQGPDVDVPFLG